MADDAKPADLKPVPPALSTPAKPQPVATEAQASAAAEIGKAIADHLTRSSVPIVATPNISKTIPGGRYLSRQKKIVNADGHEIDDDGKLLHPEQVQIDPFGRRY